VRPRQLPRLALVLAALLIALFAVRLVHTASRMSFTPDEPRYVGTALYLWDSGDYHFERSLRFHPPLTYHLAGVPLLALDLEDMQPSADLGEQLVRAAGSAVDRIRVASRLPFIALSCWGALLCFFWAREAGRQRPRASEERGGALGTGTGAGLVALFLYTFSPTLLANSALAHSDITVSVLFLQTLYLAWRWWRRPGTLRFALCGLSLGLALAAKLSALLLLAALGLLLAWIALAPGSLGRRYGEPPLPAPRDWRALLASLRWVTLRFAGWLAIAIAVLWGCYGGSLAWSEGTGPGWSSGLVLPAYLHSLLFDMGANALGRPVYFAGSFSKQSAWYVFPATFLLKVPLGLLVLLAIALSRRRPVPGGAGAFLGLPIVIYVLFACFVFRVPLGLRYLLPIFPLLFVWIALRLVPFESRARGALASLAGLWIAAASLWIHPHYLAYFNELIGPRNASRVLIESNLDWGQDLGTLARYLDERGNPEVWLAYFGVEKPRNHGMRVRLLRGCEPVEGLVAISANVLHGLYSSQNPFKRPPPGCYDWLLNREPIARPGYSILVYEIGES